MVSVTRDYAPPTKDYRNHDADNRPGYAHAGGGDDALFFLQDSPEKYTATSGGDCSFEELRFSDDEDDRQLEEDVVRVRGGSADVTRKERGKLYKNDSTGEGRLGDIHEQPAVRHAWLTPSNKILGSDGADEKSKTPPSLYNRSKSSTATTPAAAPTSAAKSTSKSRVTSDYEDPSAAMGFGIRKSFIIGRGRTSRNNNRSRCSDRPKFK